MAFMKRTLVGILPLAGLAAVFFIWRVFSTPAEAASGDPAQLAAQKNQDDILQEADSIFAEVSRLRGEPIKRPVTKKFEDQAFFRAYYLRLLEEQYPPEKKMGIEKAYVFLGFLPAGGDLIQTYLDSFMKVVEGLYDPKTQTLYIADWIKSGNQEETLAHELTHALQDQYFDLQDYIDKGSDLSMDEQFARASVMEGEAVAISLNYSLEDRNTDFTQLVNIADWVRLSNLLEAEGKRAFGKKAVFNSVVSFPYVYGAAFLQKYVKAYGWQGMAYLFRHPPTSTHQVMHPETFFPRRQNPVEVHIDDLSQGVLSGYHEVWDDTLGEYGLMTFLHRYLPDEEARNSVKGWRGDRIQVYENPTTHNLLAVGYVIFDKDDSAGDFFRNYRDFLNTKYSVDSFRRSDDTIHWISLNNSDDEAYVECFGRRAVFIEGSPSDLTTKIRGALWNVQQVKNH
jgi:hypothetical protein